MDVFENITDLGLSTKLGSLRGKQLFGGIGSKMRFCSLFREREVVAGRLLEKNRHFRGKLSAKTEINH